LIVKDFTNGEGLNKSVEAQFGCVPANVFRFGSGLRAPG
jgi:hypothetical protein